MSYLPKKSEKVIEMNNALVDMVCLDLEPFNIVNHEGFLRFAQAAEPGYKMPSRNTLTRMVTSKYESSIDAIKNEIQKDLQNGM